jgi:alpha-tubulin suppressor-like RCC1 family protein
MKGLIIFRASFVLSCSLAIPATLIPLATQAQPIPVINSFSPGSAAVGATVSISGTNFNPSTASNIIYFGAVRAIASSASPTNLLVTVPASATFAPITVTVGGLTAYASRPFLPTFSGSGQITNSSLAARLDLAAGTGPGRVLITDLDGDGKPDLAIADSAAGKISFYRNISTNGSLTAGSFASRVDLPLLLASSGQTPFTIVAADMDGDGRLDLVALNADLNVVSILRNLSLPGSLTTNSFAARIDLPAGTNLRGLAVQDLNGDGKPEIVTASQTSPGSMSIFQNLSTIGNIAFAAGVNFVTGNGSASVAIGDLDGDGKPDLVVGNYDGGSISIFRNTGGGSDITTNSFAPKVDFPAVTTCFPIEIGDMDGDGKLDLVMGGAQGSQTISVYRNTATVGIITNSSFAARVDFAAPGWVNALKLGDLDGDGKLDLAVVCQSPDVFSIFKNVSVPGNFTAASLAARVDYSAGYNPVGISVGDLDGDGRPDIAFGNFYDGTISIYQNQTPIVITPQPGCTPPPSGLVGWWKGDGNTLDSIAANNGVNQNITFSNGVVGQAFACDPENYSYGTYTGIQIADQPAYALTNSLTIEGWIRPRGDSYIIFWRGDQRPGLDPYYLSMQSSNTIFGICDAGGNSVFVEAPVNYFAWTHVAATLDGSSGTLSIYTNGVLAVQTNTNIRPFGSLLADQSPGVGIGNLNDGANNFPFIGDIDEIGLYNRALSAGEIQAIYNAGSAGKCVEIAPPVAVTLLNVDFGAGTTTTEMGKAAAGISTNDFWNFYTRDDGAGGWKTFGSLTNLQNADGTVSAAGLTVNDAPGAWSDGSADVMLNSYIYPFDGGNVTVTVTNLPAGQYDVLPYSCNGNYDVSSGGVSYGTKTCYALPVVNPPTWAEGVQYARFTNVLVNAGQPLVITAHPGIGDVAQIAGLQIALSSLTNDLPPLTVAPFITLQPTNLTVTVNGTAAFTVMSGGTQPLTYQWSFNGTNIVGATNTTLTLSNVQSTLAGNYSVTISNFVNAVTSSNALLTIYIPQTPPAIISQTPSQVVLLGNPATFSVNVSGSTPLSYFWSRNSVLIPNATNFSYTLLNAQISDSGSKFSCLVINAYGSANSTNVTLKVIDTIANDLCSGAIIVTNGSYTNVQSTANASSFGDPVPDCVDGFGNGVWYQFTAPVSGQLVVDTFGSGFDTGLAIYTGSCDSLTEVACNDDTGGVTSQVTIPTTAGTIYSILAGGYSAHTGNLVFHLNHLTPPAFVMQPTNQSVVVSSNASFSATLAGALPMSFQWYFNGAPLVDDGRIVGSTTASLSISNTTTADAGSYTLAATNFLGSASSTAAVLNVLVPPAITAQPVGRSVPPGLPTTFTAAASGNPTPTYFQWQLNGTNIPGATSSSYTIAAVNTNHLGFYHLVASNSVGGTVSADAQLTFGPVAAWGRNLFAECLPPPGLSNVIGIAGSFGESFAVRTDGSIAAWGSGLATIIPASASNVVAVAVYGGIENYALRSDGTVVGWAGVAAPALSNIVSVAAGNGFGYALRAEGTLANWGTIPTPAFPAGLNHLAAIAAGYNNAAALKNDGTIATSGSGAVTNVPGGLSNVVSVAVGYSYAMALRADGKVIAWGSGTITNLPAGLTNIIAISAGNYPNENFGLAVRSDGKVVAWGDNTFGESIPPTALSNLVSIAGAATAYHGLALVNDGSPVILHPPVGLTAYMGRDVTLHGDAAGAAPLSYQWLLNGTNISGATNTSLIIPNIQAANAGSYQLFVSNFINTALSLAAPLTIVSNNTLTFLSQITASPTNVYEGGKFTVGGITVLGNGPLRYQWFFSVTNKNYSVISGATNDTLVMDPALAINTGNYYVAVSNQFAGLTSAPVAVRVLFARAWGFQAVSNPPVNVTNAIALATGGSVGNGNGSYFALGSDGKLTSWASTGYFPIYGETNVSALSNSFVTAIAAGYQSSLALKSDGTVYAWGYGGYGQTNPPANLNGVVAIAVGGYHDLALKSDGSVVGWGATPQFNFGQATNNPAATNVVAIAAGAQHSLALRADGTVVSWGYTSDLTQIPSTVTNVVAIVAGGNFNAALRANGTVVQWGNGIISYPAPANLSNIVAISGSSTHCTALKNDGTVISWGNEYVGLASNNVPADLANVIAITSGGDHDFALFGTRAPSFTVQPWNRGILVNARTNIILAAKCAGVQPMNYQWQLNGTNVPGATNDTLILTNQPLVGAPIRLLPTGSYQLIASNAYGVVASKFAKVTTVISLGDALDATNLNWTTTGNAQWFGETNVTHDGVDAARSGGIGALQETILQTTVGTNWSGSYTFWWKVSSEQFFDTLEFRLNGVVVTNLSGEVDWQQASIPVAIGTNVLQWRYSKDVSFDGGQDAAWVDQFTFVPDPPMITLQPVSQTVNMGTIVTFRVTVIGRPEYGLIYQWRQNGNVVGSGGASLTLNNVGRAQNGTYSVTVTEAKQPPGGSTVSSNAVLKVLVPQLIGSPRLLLDGTLQFSSTDANGGLLSPSDLANFEAQASTNLVNWVTLPNALSLTNGTLLLQDAGPNNYSTRYYRIIEH